MAMFQISNQSVRWLFAELIVVILGILIAFSVDDWNQSRHENQLEKAFVNRLLEDLRMDISRTEPRLNTAEQRFSFVKLLEDSVRSPDVAVEDPTRYIRAMTEASYILRLAKQRFTFDEMINTGSLSLIEDVGIRQSLSAYYNSFDLRESYSLYQEGIVGDFAGILTTDQVFLNGDRSNLTFNEEEALVARENFLQRKEAVDSLPVLAEMQLTMRTLILQANESAERLVADLEQYRDS